MNGEKVVPLEDRLPQLKKERKRKANRRFIFYATLFFLLILVVVYFQSPLSRVHDLRVDGEQLVSAEEVIDASGLTASTHIWDVQPEEAEKRVEQLPTVREATVRVAFPNRASIQVEEYARKAYLLRDGGYYPLLQNGVTLDRLPDGRLPVDAPILYGFSDRKRLAAIADGLGQIPQEIIHSISDIHYISKPTGDDDLLIYMNDGNRVLASTDTFEKNIKLYPKIASELLKNGERGTIHLSVGSYFVPDEPADQDKDLENQGN